MKAGVPGFIGARLRQAREARGVTQVFVAERLDVTNRAVSQWEAGSAKPTVDNLTALAALLEMPVEFFLTPAAARNPSQPVYFRSLSAATKSVRVRAEHMAEWFAHLVAVIDEYVELPAVDIPELSGVDDPACLRDSEIESAADRLREMWGLGRGPISNVTYLLENHGVAVSRFPFHSESLDAFSEWSDAAHRPLVLFNTEKECAVRSRYDAAHELGHLTLHTRVDRAVFSKPAVFKEIERQAFFFAGAFMLPADTFEAELPIPTLDALIRLKSRWRVSIGAMLMRARQLQLIDEDRASRLWREYSRRGYRKNEPLDETLACESPEVVRQALDLILDSGVPVQQLLSELPYSTRDLSLLAGVPSGYFDNPNSMPIRLKPRPSTQPSDGGSGRVIEFPGRG